MHFLRNMKIRVKLMTGFGIMVVLMGIIGYIGFISVKRVQMDLETIFSVQMPSIDFLIEADRDLQQLLVAERSMIFAEPGSPLLEQFLTEYETNFNQSDTRWKKYKALDRTEEEKALFPVYEKAREQWQAESRKVIDLVKKADEASVKQAIAITLGDAKKYFEHMRDQLDQLTEINLRLAQESSQSAQSTYSAATKVLLLAILSGVLAGCLMTWLIARLITRPVAAMVTGLKDIAQGEGDLTKRLEEGGKDELGELSSWFNTFMDKLQGLIREIAAGVETLSSSSTVLSSVSETMSQGTRDVSDKANTVSAAAEEMSVNMNNVAAAMEESAINTNMVATASVEMSGTISEIARNAEKARGISGKAVNMTSTATENMDQLGTAADSIGKVIGTITDISEQVSLLALNATIEAARAGEAGKGFAVVANEIKELARQTAEATQDIKQKVQSVQGTTTMTVNQITEISQVIEDVNAVVSDIAMAVEQQSVATNEISANVAQASQGLQEVNENVNQSSSVSSEISRDIAGVSMSMAEMSASSSKVNQSAQDLFALSENLKQMVDQFKI